MERIADVKLPSYLNITNIHEVFDQVQDLIYGNEVYDQFILDTSTLTKVEPDGIVALAALMKLVSQKGLAKQRFVRHNVPLSNVENYMGRMKFFETLGFNIEYKYRKYDSSGRFCELLEVREESSVKEGSTKIIKMLENEFGDSINVVASGIATALEEVIFNVFHHSETHVPCYVCAQKYKSAKKVIIAIVDCGIGFKRHLSRTYDNITTDVQAISEALTKYISGNLQGDKRSNSGIGLYGTRKLILKNNGNMCIYTGCGSYELIHSREQYYNVPEWRGSIISLTFMLNNPITTKDFFDDEVIEQNKTDDLDDLFS